MLTHSIKEAGSHVQLSGGGLGVGTFVQSVPQLFMTGKKLLSSDKQCPEILRTLVFQDLIIVLYLICNKQG